MTNFIVGEFCSARSHARDLPIYDQLPLDVRDRLKVARTNLCAACIARMARRDLAATLQWLDHERTHRQVQTRTGTFQLAEEELRP
jgi:hypothetical protein